MSTFAKWDPLIPVDEIGAHIKELRVASGRSQTDVAAAVGITRPYLTRIELMQVKASPEVVIAILNELGSGARLVIQTPYP